jgi:hypothetical protein
MSAAAQTILTEATSFQLLGDDLTALQTCAFLLAQVAGAPFNTMNAQALLSAATGFQIYGDELTALQVIAYELSQISSTGGGGGGGGTASGVTFTSSGAGTSPLVAAGIAASTTGMNQAVDTSTARIWVGWSGVWH